MHMHITHYTPSSLLPPSLARCGNRRPLLLYKFEGLLAGIVKGLKNRILGDLSSHFVAIRLRRWVDVDAYTLRHVAGIITRTFNCRMKDAPHLFC